MFKNAGNSITLIWIPGHTGIQMCSSLKELFENVDATTIMVFIKETSFYHLV